MLQHFAALFFWQIDIENDQAGTGQIGVGVDPIEKPHRLFSIFGDIERKRESGGAYRLFDQKHVRFIVVHNKHMKVNTGRRFVRRGA